MKNLIVIVLFLSVCCAASFAKAEVLNYECGGGSFNTIKIDTGNSTAIATLWPNQNLKSISPVVITGYSATWKMSDPQYPNEIYDATLVFNKNPGSPFGAAELSYKSTSTDATLACTKIKK